MMNKSPVRITSKSHRTEATTDPSAPIRPLTAPAPWNNAKGVTVQNVPHSALYSTGQGHRPAGKAVFTPAGQYKKSCQAGTAHFYEIY